jgi:hypothetical protein
MLLKEKSISSLALEELGFGKTFNHKRIHIRHRRTGDRAPPLATVNKALINEGFFYALIWNIYAV